MRRHQPAHRTTALQRFARSRTAPFLAAFLATAACLPVQADIPLYNQPLQAGSSLPPNVMFILDNSGSMALVSMPAKSESFDVEDPDYTGTNTGRDQIGLNDDPHDRSYLNNTIYYNPGKSYLPWMTADGVTRMTGGTSVDEVYTSWNLADTSDGTRDLRNNDESIFYVPNTGVTDSTDPDDFVRYWIRKNGSGNAEVVRAGDSKSRGTWTQDIGEGAYKYQTVNVPSGTDQLVVEIAGNTGSRGNADLYVRRTANPTTGNYDYRDTGSGSTQSITINAPQSGDWHIGVYNSDSGRNDRTVYGNVLTVTAYSLEVATPTGRTQAAELTNIATWYSYYRTRLKTAKGGGAEAFSGLGRDFRVGFTTINQRAPGLTGTAEVIPVGTNNGLFESANKVDWFSKLVKAVVGDGSTPLRGALNAVGTYYTREDKSGPWGPGELNDQLSCRQSFSILTTDGYWNDSSDDKFGMGDEDGDGHSVSLADVARYYYTNDLRAGTGGLANNVPYATNETDKPNYQRMVTFGVSVGLKGNMVQTDPPPAHDSSSWTDPMDREDADRIDDLWHATVNTYGQFVVASNPQEFAEGLQKALAAIQEATSSSSNVAPSAITLSTGTQLFSASFVSGLWTGKMESYLLKPTMSLQWTSTIPAAGSRNIVTRANVTGSGTTTGNGVSFAWANLNAGQKTGLGGDTLGPDVLAYLRGDQSKEGTGLSDFRKRTSLLGDIVHSSPVYVSESSPTMVYAGGNDGMLHGFNAGTGAEVLAYVPAGLDFAQLKTLSDKSYAHHYYVDGPIAVSTRDQTPGKNLLVGLLGQGGKSVYALDVSNPSGFGASNALWEFSDPDLGYAIGEPIIVKLNSKKVDGTNQVGVIIGNGYNSGSGKSAIFILDLETGALIRKFVTSKGDTTEAGSNGMAAPRVWDANRSGTADYVYSGDLLGNLWKFDISDSDSTKWANAVAGSAPLFTTPAGQSITGGVTIGLEPSTNKRWVFFGTGRYLTPGDPKNDDQQAWYGLIDSNSTARVLSDLQQRTITSTTTADGKTVRTFEQNTPLGDKQGWYINLEGGGSTSDAIGSERITTRPVLDGRVLIVSSAIPNSDACSPGGSGYVNFLDPYTGTSTSQPYYDVNGDGVIDGADDVSNPSGDPDVPNVPVGSVDFDVGMPTMPVLMYDSEGKAQLCVSGSGGKLECGDFVFPEIPGRISWREIVRE